jgi:hypothetical protein
LFEFFLESIALTIFSGLAGLIAALVICDGVSRLPLPTLFAGLPVNTCLRPDWPLPRWFS